MSNRHGYHATGTFGLENWTGRVWGYVPGVTLAVVVAFASQFVSEHYAAPAMPLALLALRISYEMVGALCWPMVLPVVLMVPATIAFGLAASRFVGFRYRFAFGSAATAAICGASAALANSALLPKDDRSQVRLVVTVVGVTILLAVAMMLYPIVRNALGFDDVTGVIYLGATIRDVAQVMGAGFSISPEAGETATLHKLLRAAMLAPVVILTALALQRVAAAEPVAGRPPVVPGVVVALHHSANAEFDRGFAPGPCGVCPRRVGLAATHCDRRRGLEDASCGHPDWRRVGCGAAPRENPVPRAGRGLSAHGAAHLAGLTLTRRETCLNPS